MSLSWRGWSAVAVIIVGQEERSVGTWFNPAEINAFMPLAGTDSILPGLSLF